MIELKNDELYFVDGGAKLETVSDWLIFSSQLCFCFAIPQIGVPALIATTILL